MSIRALSLAGAAGLALALPTATDAGVVTQWNTLALQAIQANNTPPPAAARALAMMHVAMYDAVNSIERTHTQFRSLQTPAGAASVDAAAATAAARVLGSIYSANQSTYNTIRDNTLASIADPVARVNGQSVGHSAAGEILTWRATDGASTAVPAFTGGTNPGQWRPTPPANANGALPQWPNVTPFAMNSGSQFRPPAPPALNTQAYADALNEVKSLGSATSATRTADQTEIALIWKAGANTVTPPGQWNQIATQISTNTNQSTADAARMFAQLNVALADAGIAAWDCKYFFPTWRPITAIQLADTDGNPNTFADPSWTPLIPTPNHPTYTSGHSTFSRAGATALQRFLGTDTIDFSLINDVDAPGAIRFFSSLDDAANEAGRSRIYGGIHFDFDNVFGQECGFAVGNWVADNYFQAIPSPTATPLLALAGLAAFRRRRDR